MTRQKITDWEDFFDTQNTVNVMIHPVLPANPDGTRKYGFPQSCRAIVQKKAQKIADQDPAIILTLLLYGTEPPAAPGSLIEFEDKKYSYVNGVLSSENNAAKNQEIDFDLIVYAVQVTKPTTP